MDIPEKLARLDTQDEEKQNPPKTHTTQITLSLKIL
jgi:hypothetical protein